VKVDNRCQVKESAFTDRQVGDVADVALVHARGGEVTANEIRCFRRGRIRDGGLHPAAQPQALDAVAAHHPGQLLVVDPLPAVVQFGGDPGAP
jgi:hypothetical protein